MSGVMVVTDDKICSADDVLKTRTTALETFECPNYGYMGYVYNGKAIFTRNNHHKHTFQTEFDINDITELPKVDIVYGYAGIDSLFVNTLVKMLMMELFMQELEMEIQII